MEQLKHFSEDLQGALECVKYYNKPKKIKLKINCEVNLMKSKNILSLCYSAKMDTDFCAENDIKIDNVLKPDEYIVLKDLCNLFLKSNVWFDLYEGYFLGYTIPQISNEFDLLRFSQNTIINIELKSELGLPHEEKNEKIRKQLEKNYYYLKLLDKEIFCYSYVLNDGLYKYDFNSNTITKVDINDLFQKLQEQNQTLYTELDLNSLFIPKNYLVSPFNKTDRFIKGEYFLTDAQINIKKEILSKIDKKQFFTYCISANAGTGKTLLVYDIAKSLISESKNILIVHCGILNNGHLKLNTTYKWRICAIKYMIQTIKFALQRGEIYDLVIFDEAQRIKSHQIDFAVNQLKDKNIPIIFSYDVRQYLRENEAIDLYKYLNENFNDIDIFKSKLTNKIRMNKEIASFITNLFEMGKSISYTNYDNITIEYFKDKATVKNYLQMLEAKGYKAIGYTVSLWGREGLDALNHICIDNAHSVIGQEFDKVIFVMDDNFMYSERNNLMARKNYYDPRGMLYQIVTRAVSELKIVVLGNEQLYKNILKIKHNKMSPRITDVK